jgi:hypothetical protein
MNALDRWSHRHEHAYLLLMWDAIWIGMLIGVLLVELVR